MKMNWGIVWEIGWILTSRRTFDDDKMPSKKVKFEGPSVFLKIWPEDVECGSFVSIIRKLKVSLKITRDGHFPIFKLLSLIAIYSLSPFVHFLISLAPFNSFYPPLYISQSSFTCLSLFSSRPVLCKSTLPSSWTIQTESIPRKEQEASQTNMRPTFTRKEE